MRGSMKTRGDGIVGYNVQTAVEAEHHLIVAHEVTNKGSDRDQFSPIAEQAGEAMDTEELTVIADAGYSKCEELLSCYAAGVTANVSRPDTSGNRANGVFGRQDFRYLPRGDEYSCPAGEHFTWCFAGEENGLLMHRCWSPNCQGCELKSRCTPAKERRITRWEFEELLEAM